RQHAQADNQNAVYQHDQLGQQARCHRMLFTFWFVEVNNLHDTQVVESTNQGHDHGKHSQPDIACTHHSLQNTQLGSKAGQRRNTSQGEHGQQPDQSQTRVTAVQAFQVADVFAFKTTTAQDQDQTESAQGGQNVDHYIEQRSTVGLRVSLAIEHASQQAQENETHVRDGRIRKHTLEILLHDRSQVIQSQRQDSHDQQHGLPVHGNTV